jgi:uncharacterized protein with ACT and thioredoxin-like domain
MANVDRPNGFYPVRTLSGAPMTSLIRAVGVADSADIFVGDPVTLTSGLAAPSATNDSAILGIAVGFGKFDKDGKTPLGPYNPGNLMKRFYDDSESTHTEWVCYYVPADDLVFEAQTATALTKVVGDTIYILYTAGSQTTGISACEITTNSNADVTVIQIPLYPDNDHTLVWGRYHVMFTRAEQAFHA